MPGKAQGLQAPIEVDALDYDVGGDVCPQQCIDGPGVAVFAFALYPVCSKNRADACDQLFFAVHFFSQPNQP